MRKAPESHEEFEERMNRGRSRLHFLAIQPFLMIVGWLAGLGLWWLTRN